MSKVKKIFSNTKVIIMLVLLLMAVIVIHPALTSGGVTIRTVEKGSVAELAGMMSPDPTTKPMNRERIEDINGKNINSMQDYDDFVSTLKADQLVIITTNKNIYELRTVEDYEIITLNETEIQNVTTSVFNETLNETVEVTEQKVVQKTEKNVLGVAPLGLGVYPAPSNNIQKGLDLEGGTRVILKPAEVIDAETADLIIDNIKQRLNVYGLSDILVKSVADFDGSQYILVEIAGANQEEVRELLAQQGKFEAKIGNITVFKGGTDIVNICRDDPKCSGIDPNVGCKESSEGWFCGFRFSISLSPEAAQAQADATRDLAIIPSETGGDGYLSKNITLYLDDELYDELRIGASLRGNALTDIAISGTGTGATREAAGIDAQENMKKLQTVLKTGSLPVKLDIVQSDAVSPVLGEEFIKNALWIGFLSLLAVVAVILIRYKKMIISIPVIVTMVSEIVLLLGFAALSGWRLDLAAIAGIIIAVGTGVDDQIVIVDETLSQEKSSEHLSWFKKLKKAFFIIMTAYFTTVVAMLPLFWSGAGLLKGFALTTIMGVSLGVFITRPAFASMIEILVGHKSSLDDDED